MEVPKAIEDWALMRAALRKEIAFMKASGFASSTTLQRLVEKLAEIESSTDLGREPDRVAKEPMTPE